ncbi:MAG: hypothetical protein R3B72_44150 [Polyangiaceae bacterium]
MARLSLLIALSLLAGCESGRPNATPEGAVQELVEHIRSFHGHEEDAREILALLSQRARDNLQARADRYSAASGKQIAPWAMIAPSRALTRFDPQAYHAQIVGKYALVDIFGVSEAQHAQIPCVLEDGDWHVDLVLPELPELQTRPGIE